MLDRFIDGSTEKKVGRLASDAPEDTGVMTEKIMRVNLVFAYKDIVLVSLIR